MAEVEIKNVSKKYAKYISKHLPSEHPKTRGHIEVDLESEKKSAYSKLKGTIFTGEF